MSEPARQEVWTMPCAFCEQMECRCAVPRPPRPYDAMTDGELTEWAWRQQEGVSR